ILRTAFLLFGYPLPNAVADAQDDAERALSLEAGLPEALETLGIVNAVRGAWIEAATNFQAALAADPSDNDIFISRSVFLQLSVGHLRNAESDVTEAYRLAPALAPAAAQIAIAKSYRGSDADAVRSMNLAIALGQSPNIAPLLQVSALAATRTGHYS